MLLACAGSGISVQGSETLPWGVERIRAYCVWDNNMDMVVDLGAKRQPTREHRSQDYSIGIFE